MTLLYTVRAALSGMATNKLRAALATLGIIIGVSSVISMLALGNGARAAVESSFRLLGSDSIRVTAKHKLDQGERVPIGQILSFDDGLRMVDGAELVDQVAMSVGGAAKVRGGGLCWTWG